MVEQRGIELAYSRYSQGRRREVGERVLDGGERGDGRWWREPEALERRRRGAHGCRDGTKALEGDEEAGSLLTFLVVFQLTSRVSRVTAWVN